MDVSDLLEESAGVLRHGREDVVGVEWEADWRGY